ncbi:MAG TPA: AI-2E family transporter [Actinoplanes sp.]|nr:AI-2E family transporter [Actinoplanes sp.]
MAEQRRPTGSDDEPPPAHPEPTGPVSKHAAPVDARSAHPEPDDAEAGQESPFGPPGPPLNRRNPLLIGFTGGLGLLLAYAVYQGISNAASMLVLIFIALFLAVGLNPAVQKLRDWGLPRGLAVTSVTLGIMLIACGGLFALVPPLITQTGEFIEQLPGFVSSLQRNVALKDLIEQYDVVERVKSVANAGTVTNALGGVLGGAQLVAGTIFSSVTVLVLTIYFMASFDRIKEGAYQLVPASRQQRVRALTDEILAKVGAYMVGALAIAVLAGLCTWVFALIIGLAYPFALAVVVAICDLIPQIGATIGAVVVSIVGFATSLTAGIACLVFFVVYQQVENYVIYPRVMQRSVKVSDVAAVVAALLGVALFGVLGALIAIPLVAAIQLIIREVVVPSQRTR